MNEKQDLSESEESPPPQFKSWNTIYMLVLGNLALVVILFYVFTKVFNE